MGGGGRGAERTVQASSARRTARVVRDPAETTKHWKEEWARFYQNRNRGDDYLLIRVDPMRLEVVAGALGLTNDPITWRPVILDFKCPS